VFGRSYVVHFDSPSFAFALVLIIAFVVWIDRIMRAERRALRRSRRAEDRFQRIFETTQVGLILIDPRTRVVHSVNPTFCEISGYSRDEIVGHSPTFLMHEGQSPVLETPEMPRLLSGELPSVRRTAVMTRPSGENVIVDIVAMIVSDEDGRPMLAGTVIDRTAHLHAEEQARRAQRLDAVGRLAGGIAHDFNNLLTVISGYAALALEEELEPRVADDVNAIRQAANRAAALTRQLLAFSRKVVLRPQPLDLNLLIADLGAMLSRLIEARIDVQTKLAPDLPPVHADETQVEQVLMNLILNARDAMPSGGSLTIATSCATFEDGDERLVRELDPGEYVAVSVADTGVGMTEDTVAHAFEPFFTTKGERGTGLGLATVHGIVHQSGGSVDISTQAGVGTTVTVYLPVSRDAVADSQTPPAPAAHGRTGGARILLVEDEPAVRDLAEAILDRAGHEVFSAQHADTALELVDDGLEVDLLLTDIVMPGRSGVELAAELERRSPGVSVVYMSGYTESTQRAVAADDAIFVPKPFDTETLLGHIDAALARRASEARGR